MKALNLIRKLLLVPVLLAWFGSSAQAFYDASVGRWINRDPLGDDGSLVNLLARHEPLIQPSSITGVVSGPFETWGGANLYAYAENNPINFIDPFGLTSIHVQIAVAIAKGDVAALQALLGTGVLTAAQSAQVQAAITRLNSSALQWIARNCKGSIAREFPSQLYNKTLEQIKNMKDADGKKAWKLLNDGRFKK